MHRVFNARRPISGELVAGHDADGLGETLRWCLQSAG